MGMKMPPARCAEGVERGVLNGLEQAAGTPYPAFGILVTQIPNCEAYFFRIGSRLGNLSSPGRE